MKICSTSKTIKSISQTKWQCPVGQMRRLQLPVLLHSVSARPHSFCRLHNGHNILSTRVDSCWVYRCQILQHQIGVSIEMTSGACRCLGLGCTTCQDTGPHFSLPWGSDEYVVLTVLLLCLNGSEITPSTFFMKEPWSHLESFKVGVKLEATDRALIESDCDWWERTQSSLCI